MAAVLLDTTVLIDALRGRAAADRVRRLRSSGDTAYVCAINAEEVWRGSREHEEVSVARLLRGLRLAPLGKRQGQVAGMWRAQYAARGVTLHQAECLIAAAAIGVRARLATGNPRHFPMDGLQVEHWPVGV